MATKGEGKKDMVVTRVFDAPRSAVWEAFTNPKKLVRWWGPKDFTSPSCRINLKTGCSIKIDMRAPDGAKYPISGVYREIVKPERLVISAAALDRNKKPIFEVLQTFIFAERGKKTKVTARARVTKVHALEAYLYLPGMKQGWNESLDRLAAELE